MNGGLGSYSSRDLVIALVVNIIAGIIVFFSTQNPYLAIGVPVLIILLLFQQLTYFASITSREKAASFARISRIK